MLRSWPLTSRGKSFGAECDEFWCLNPASSRRAQNRLEFLIVTSLMSSKVSSGDITAFHILVILTFHPSICTHGNPTLLTFPPWHHRWILPSDKWKRAWRTGTRTQRVRKGSAVGIWGFNRWKIGWRCFNLSYSLALDGVWARPMLIQKGYKFDGSGRRKACVRRSAFRDGCESEQRRARADEQLTPNQ